MWPTLNSSPPKISSIGQAGSLNIHDFPSVDVKKYMSTLILTLSVRKKTIGGVWCPKSSVGRWAITRLFPFLAILGGTTARLPKIPKLLSALRLHMLLHREVLDLCGCTEMYRTYHI